MPINIPFQNDSKTSLYIADLSNKTGKTYRELKALWDKFYNEIQFDIMYNPTKYATYAKGNVYEEAGRRLETYLQPVKKETISIQPTVDEPTVEEPITPEIEPNNEEINQAQNQTTPENTSDVETEKPEEFVETNKTGSENKAPDSDIANSNSSINKIETEDQMSQVPTDKELGDMLAQLKL